MANDTMPARKARVKFHVTLYYVCAKVSATVYAVDHADAMAQVRQLSDRAQHEETCSADCLEVRA